MPKIVPDDRARQGPPGRPVLGVLIGALVLCVVAIGGYLVWVGLSSPSNPNQDASRSAVTGSSSSNPANRTSPAYPAPAEPSATGTTNPQ
ncbi:hypothetical protein [Microvirga sp. 2TAF3]|uniref:hypothetical protein n=1 Tax=Microvirga sp. 2TAF3 TaxID=3233014 RepID=UPI003F9695CB